MRILVNLKNKIVPVDFKWDFVYPDCPIRGCSFTTDDVEMQKALEAHEYFNRKLEPSFWTDDKEPSTLKKEEKEPSKVKRYKESKV